MSTNSEYTGRYELQEPLNQGGRAEVWKAFDIQTRQYVAIKFLYASLREDPDFGARFQREAQAIAALHHPNIVRYHDFFISQPPGSENITASIVMDFVDGGTLGDYLRNTSRQGKFPTVPEIIRLFISIGAALEYAHQRGVVHGQLKPTNILLDKLNATRNLMGEPVLTDFATAGLIAATLSSTGSRWSGLPLYLSPEQITNLPGDARSDVYALGIMLYEICTGTPPFPGNAPAAIMTQHLNTVPASPVLINPAVPPALVAIIMRSIAKDPAQRFPGVSALIAALASGEQQAVMAPLPVNVGAVQLAADANLPTILSSEHPLSLTPPPNAASSPALPTSLPGLPAFSLNAGPASLAGIGTAAQAQMAQTPGGPPTPLPTVFAPGQVLTTGPSVLPLAAPPLAPPPRRAGGRRLRAVLAVLLVVLLAGSGLAAYLLVRSTSSAPARGSQVIGHAYFVSSGLLSANPETVQGITDELQIRLEQVPAPPVGKSYYGWLLNAKTLEWLPIPLGPLTVRNGTLVYFYPGDAQHADLLATNSRFLITLGDIASPPTTPDASALAYYAAFSETVHPFGTEKFSLYDHIRHLLANDPKVQAAGLTGGLDIWLYRNTEKMLEWAGSARGAALPATRNLPLLRRQLARIIDYLDGIAYAQRDLPGTPLYVDPTIARIGLLTFDPANQNPPGYLYHMDKHLHEISVLPETTEAQRKLTLQIDQGINAVNAWDQQIRSDVLALLKMSDTQLVGSLNLLDEVATLANDAFVGKVNPLGQVTYGVTQIHYASQALATFNVQVCQTSSPCPSLI
ncbi:MAG TPA: protein kinase [Ktedonobacteraceae bacterium]|jgi:serine/threonine protein kinase